MHLLQRTKEREIYSKKLESPGKTTGDLECMNNCAFE